MKIVSRFISLSLVLIAQLLLLQGAAAEAPASVTGAKTIGIDEAFKLYESGAVFIDVRDSSSWNYGHIEGSVNLDFNEDEFVILYVSDALDRAAPVVFYDDSELVSSSAMASFFAASWGYENVYYFRKGYYAWLASDFPVEFNVANK